MIGRSLVSSQQDGLEKLAKHARTVLVVIAALQLGGAALVWMAGGPAEQPLLIPSIVAGVIYGGLALWARSAPMPAVVTGLVLFVLSQVAAVLQGGSIFDGLLLKVILIALFLNGLGSARQHDEAKKRLATRPPNKDS